MSIENSWSKAAENADTEKIEGRRMELLAKLASQSKMTLGELNGFKRTEADGVKTLEGTLRGINLKFVDGIATLDGIKDESPEMQEVWGYLDEIVKLRDATNEIAIEGTYKAIDDAEREERMGLLLDRLAKGE